MSKKGIVTVKYTPEPIDTTLLNMASIRIEIDESKPDSVWIWMIEDGVQVEGGEFSLGQLMNLILEFYNTNY